MPDPKRATMSDERAGPSVDPDSQGLAFGSRTRHMLMLEFGEKLASEIDRGEVEPAALTDADKKPG